MLADNQKEREYQVRALTLQIDKIASRSTRLMDVYLDGSIDRQAFEEKRLGLLTDRKELEDERDRVAQGNLSFIDGVSQYLELMKMAPLCYEMANPVEK